MPFYHAIYHYTLDFVNAPAARKSTISYFSNALLVCLILTGEGRLS